jgi:glycosyltransferase involved in cell wall biosynthesis
MKVCFIAEANSYHTERFTRKLALAGCEVHVVSKYKAEIPGVQVHYHPIYSKNPLRQIINNQRVEQIIGKINPQIIHIFGLFSVASLGSMFLVKKFKNLVVTVQGSDIVPGTGKETFKEKIIKRFLLKHPNHIISVSEYLSEQLKKYLSKPKGIDVIYGGVDLEMFRPSDEIKENNTITLGFAKRLHTLSAPDVLLKAFNYAKERSKRNLLLRIAGEGPMEIQLKKDVYKMGFCESVNWLGWLETPEKLSEFYRSLDMFMMPSRKESLGIAAIEASASGLPVIASSYGGIPEVIINGKTGLLVKVDDIEAFGKAILILSEDKSLRKKMGIEGRRRIKANFGWDKTIHKTIEIYNQVYKNNYYKNIREMQ